MRIQLRVFNLTTNLFSILICIQFDADSIADSIAHPFALNLTIKLFSILISFGESSKKRSINRSASFYMRFDRSVQTAERGGFSTWKALSHWMWSRVVYYLWNFIWNREYSEKDVSIILKRKLQVNFLLELRHMKSYQIKLLIN